jgi:glycosyltransferase involved in cell wall biosynthesis
VSFSGRRYAFILPRYFPGIVGGAETLSGELAQRAAAAGAEVEIWTTCAVDNRSWENALPEGKERFGSIPLHHFSVDERDLEKWIPLQIRLSEGVNLSLEEQFIWMEESVNSTTLYHHIQEHAHEFDLLFFAPYLFGTTFWGSLIAPEKSVLIPCLHDEANAYLEIVESMFRQVRGCLFNAEPEQSLARALYGTSVRGGVVGMGFEQFDHTVPVPSARTRFDLAHPYALYLGRMETGKNAHIMLDYFVEGKESGLLPSDMKIVIAGGGSFSDLMRPHYESRSDIVPVGRVGEEEKRGLLRDAVALVQPSTNESFCIVMMEGWREGTPAMVHEQCAVTKHHVQQSDGGLYFRDAADFAGVLRTLYDDPKLASELGASGKRYLERIYSWDAVMSRFEKVLSALLEETKCDAEHREVPPIQRRQ